MKEKLIKDVMLPLDQYAKVHIDASLRDAIDALEASQTKLPQGMQPHRAVLVEDKEGKIIGKVGHLAMLKALEPKYQLFGNLKSIAAANLSSGFIEKMMGSLELWQDKFVNLCGKAEEIKVKDIMQEVSESVNADDSLVRAIHKIIVLQHLSLIVMDEGLVVGIIRVSDIYDELAKIILTCENKKTCGDNCINQQKK